MGESDFKQFMRLSNQPIIEEISGEQNCSLLQVSTMSQNMYEYLKLAKWVFDVGRCGSSKQKDMRAMLRYKVIPRVHMLKAED